MNKLKTAPVVPGIYHNTDYNRCAVTALCLTRKDATSGRTIGTLIIPGFPTIDVVENERSMAGWDLVKEFDVGNVLAASERVENEQDRKDRYLRELEAKLAEYEKAAK